MEERVRHAATDGRRSGWTGPRWVLVRRIGTLAVVGLGFLALDYFLAVRHGFFDLQVYYGAIRYWMHGGSLYDYLLPLNTYGYTYPPFAALTMLPMGVVPWNPAIVISCLATGAATIAVIYWLVDPVARRNGWSRWYVLLFVLACSTVFEPLRETFLFGQVNMLLVFLVMADVVLFLIPGRRLAGLGIGLATAIKLTPGVFILYLLLTKRWKPALVASITAFVATVIAAAISPSTSLVFWTDALWNTDRVGVLATISNQSLNGAVQRLNDTNPSTALWLATVVVVLVIWVVRVRRSMAAGDEMTGIALTGLVGCLISPVTWVHHLVWVGPAILLLLDNATVARTTRRRVWLTAFMILSAGILCSHIVWSYELNWHTPVKWFLANLYVWVTVALLIGLPIRRPVPAVGTAAPATVEGDGESRTLQSRITIAGGEPNRELAPAGRDVVGGSG
jgi:alpha-1,2-mannosyltransferase